MYLEHGQGMSITNQNAYGWRANDADNQGTTGNKLRSQGTGQTNASGFSGLLAGWRHPGAAMQNRTGSGYWWSSSAPENWNAFVRTLSAENRGVHRYNYTKGFANSIRCLKD
jgi:uncharacterized protein (TIGR02145 family)